MMAPANGTIRGGLFDPLEPESTCKGCITLKWIGIALFGALGGLLRAWLATPTFGMRETSITVLFNVVGAFALGYLASTRYASSWPQWLRTGLCTGLIGAMTTFSGFLGDVLEWSHIDPWVSAGVFFVTVGGSLAGAFTGIELAIWTDNKSLGARRSRAASSQTRAKELIS